MHITIIKELVNNLLFEYQVLYSVHFMDMLQHHFYSNKIHNDYIHQNHKIIYHIVFLFS